MASTVLVPLACASFEASESGGSGETTTVGAGDGGTEGSPGADGAPDASAEAGAIRSTKLYVFGGVTAVAGFEEHVLEAHVASIREDGSLGNWEPAPALDVIRSYMATVDVLGGPLVMAGGNGRDIGKPESNFTGSREDVGVAPGEPPETWRAGPALGAGNGRWAAPATFMGGRVYVGGGRVGSTKRANTVMAAPISGTPPTLQPWKGVGTLPAAMGDHGLVALGSRLYVLGGSVVVADGGVATARSTFMASIDAEDMLTAWESAGDLPKPREAFSIVTDESRIFLIGGDDGSGSATNTVFIGTPTATKQLAWEESTPLKAVRRHLCAVRANGRLYAIGGADATHTPAVEVGVVNGSSITWRETTPLPVARSAMGCMAR